MSLACGDKESSKEFAALAPDCGGMWWAQTSIPVVGRLADESWRTEFDFAVSFWGDLIVETDGNLLGPSTCFVVSEGSFSQEKGGHALPLYSTKTCEIVWADVTVNGFAPTLLRKRIMAHELGHVLGLAHDSRTESVMFKKARDGPFDISRHHRVYLENRYGKFD